MVSELKHMIQGVSNIAPKLQSAKQKTCKGVVPLAPVMDFSEY